MPSSERGKVRNMGCNLVERGNCVFRRKAATDSDESGHPRKNPHDTLINLMKGKGPGVSP